MLNIKNKVKIVVLTNAVVILLCDAVILELLSSCSHVIVVETKPASLTSIPLSSSS